MGRRAEHTIEEQRRMALDATLSIVASQGLRGLSVRRIASRMGYASGTLYQLFSDLDDLIITLNTETLEMLLERVRRVDLIGIPADTLVKLAEVYLGSVAAEPRRWNAVFEYNPPMDREMPERYQAAVGKLLGIVEVVLAPLFGPGEDAQRLHEARVMWAGLYGIATLASSRKTSVEIDSSHMVRSLASTYVAGLQARRAQAAE